MREVLAIVFLAAMTCTVTTAASGLTHQSRGCGRFPMLPDWLRQREDAR